MKRVKFHFHTLVTVRHALTYFCQNIMSCTDYLRLNEQKIFKTVRETIPKGIVKTQNILTVKDDVLFVWNFQDSCVLTLNVKAAKSREGDNVSYQVSFSIIYKLRYGLLLISCVYTVFVEF